MRYGAAVLACVLVLACTENSVTPPDPSFELVDIGSRLDPSQVNAHAYGSFRVDGGKGTAAVITSGPANFPGKPKSGPGTCVDGLWYNSNGKPTSGSLTKPHPHCIRSAAAIEVVLEPISVCYNGFPEPAVACKRPANTRFFTHTAVNFDVLGARVTGFAPTSASGVPKTEGLLSITAYAIDATTLGTTNHRVGTLTIDLTQYNSPEANYLALDENGNPTCSVDPAQPSPCINKVISAKYNPLPPPNGLGPTDFSVSGFLWLTPASSPYNYLDDLTYLRDVVCPAEWAARFPGFPNVPTGLITSPFEAQLYCESIGASTDAECYGRVLFLAFLSGPGPVNPCIAVA
jgi:hypothetical protein